MYFKQLIDVIDYFHIKGVYHRGLKPENLLDSRGNLEVSDFGLSTLSQNVSKVISFADNAYLNFTLWRLRIWRIAKDYTVQRYKLRLRYYSYLLGLLVIYFIL